jgi:16S rRNA processing protein RimM
LQEKLVTIARVGAPHGIFGHLRLQLFLEDPDSVYDFKTWFMKLGHESSFKPLTHFEISEKGNQFYVLFPPITDRDQAKRFTHAELAVPRTELPTLTETEFYWDDLIGLSVIDQHQQIIGILESFIETGSHDVMVIRKTDKTQELIPYVYDKIVKNVNLTDKVMQVEWEPL